MNIVTPIIKYKYIYIKDETRHNLHFANGGKLRQMETFILNNLELIQTKYNNNVVAGYSVNSFFMVVLSTVCNKYNIHCHILVYKQSSPSLSTVIAYNQNAKIYGCSVGYQNVLSNYIKKYFNNYFNINDTFYNDDTLISSVSNQVVNIPSYIKNVVIPIGSGFNFVSILNGLDNIDYKGNIYGVYVGKNPYNIINKYYTGKLSYKIIKSNFPYSKKLNIDNYYFDPVYEAKAYSWLVENINVKKEQTLLWVIGKRNMDKSLLKQITYLKIHKPKINRLDLFI